MVFDKKGGEGGSRGGLECHIPILKNDFFKYHLESFPDCENVFCTCTVWALYYVYIVLEMTLYMAK